MNSDQLEAVISHELGELVRRKRSSLRAVSRSAGYSPDYLSQVLKGHQDLKVAHILKALEALDESPARFFARVARVLEGVTGEALDEVREQPATYGDENMAFIRSRVREEAARDRGALDELVRRIVRDELGKGGRAD